MVLSTNTPNKIVYGAFTQLEDAKARRFVTYQAARIPFVYGDEEGGACFYRLTSCPLPMPADILGICIVEALAGGVGPFMREGDEAEGPERPYFESEHGGKPKSEVEDENGNGGYGSKTVAELREEASGRGIDIPARATKGEIIEALEDADKGNG